MKYSKREVLKATTLQRKLVTDYKSIENGFGPSSKIGQWMLGGRKRTQLPDGYQGKALQECPSTIPVPDCVYDRTGRRYGELTVVGFHSFKPGTTNHNILLKLRWVMQCSCGKYEVRKDENLTTMHTKSRRCIECQAEHWLHEQDCYACTGYFPEDLLSQTGKVWQYQVNGRTYGHPTTVLATTN